MFSIDSAVRHANFGAGTVIGLNGPIAFVRFEHGLEAIETGELTLVTGVAQQIREGTGQRPLELMHRIQGEAIRSINAQWGVFARARIDLLPHQLWVCRQVSERHPARFLVADDVGLGKTIEAGMILSSLLASGRVRRLLVMCPAKLVSQWQERLRTMFEIRLSEYHPDLDTPKSDFWNTQNMVVASLDTLKIDHKNRHERLLKSEPFDVLIVDEAHRMGADEESGFTLGYRLVRQLLELRRAHSAIFFTGTPHRGKDFGFFALLQLLRPDLFEAGKPARDQYSRLSDVLIRNNKALVTDLHGNKLFQEVQVSSETYTYSPQEAHFYDRLTDFISTGKLYANSLTGEQSRSVMLVLIAMQKLASSSVAAIRSAIGNRLNRVRSGRETLAELQSRYLEALDSNDTDTQSDLETRLLEVSHSVKLMADEEPALRSLLEDASEVRQETKIEKILQLLETRFRDRQVLFFTEYKATQSLLLSALMKVYGPDSAAFINGDDALNDVKFPNDSQRNLSSRREDAAQRFNAGQVRFLISTEAGGEGIDLQERCWTLIHVDLPWNPMRLHQRVGRLNRYGQTHRVEVLSLRNPDTVEARVWDLLEQKLERITAALGRGMDDPEDMLQLVLGMTGSGAWNELFSSSTTEKEKLGAWFDQKTARFGGEDALDAVRKIAGSAAKFDFAGLSEKLPRVDLPDLKPFFELSLALQGRRLMEKDGELSFNTPDDWRKDELNALLMPREYENLTFDRHARGRSVLGIGHEALEAALSDAAARDTSVTAIPREVSSVPVAVFRVQSQTTGEGARPIIAAIASDVNRPLLDWQVLQLLNGWNWRRKSFDQAESSFIPTDAAQDFLSSAQTHLEANLGGLQHSFKHPQVEPLALFWPI